MVEVTIQSQLTCKNAQSADQWTPVMGVLLGLSPPPPWSSIRGRSLFFEGGGGEGGRERFGAKQGEILPIPPLNITLLKWSPLITFDDFRDPLSPCLHFPSKFEWSPLWILPKFSAIPSIGFSVTTDPPFCSPKNQGPPPQVMNNVWSLMSSLICSGEKCRLISPTAASNEVLSILYWDSREIELTLLLPFVPVIKCLLSYLSAILFMYASFHSGLTSNWWLWPWSKWYENL